MLDRLFGAVYVLSVDWMPSFVFVVAAAWFALAYIPSVLVRLTDDPDVCLI